MNFRLANLSFDEKDIFIFFFGFFLISAVIFKISVFPFRFSSLVVIFLFILLTRSIISQLKVKEYLFIVLTGLTFSTFLSPYGLVVYFFLMTIVYKKTNLI